MEKIHTQVINGYLVAGTPFHPHTVGLHATALEEAVAVDSLKSKSPPGQPNFISPHRWINFHAHPKKKNFNSYQDNIPKGIESSY